MPKVIQTRYQRLAHSTEKARLLHELAESQNTVKCQHEEIQKHKENAKRQQEEMRRKEEDVKWQKEEIKRKQEELKHQNDEINELHGKLSELEKVWDPTSADFLTKS